MADEGKPTTSTAKATTRPGARIIRHRLYLTARFLAALLAVGAWGVLGVAVVHDYAVGKADPACFDRAWREAVARADPLVGLADAEMEKLKTRCHVSIVEPRDDLTEAEMMHDLQAADAAGDTELAQRIAGRIRAARVAPVPAPAPPRFVFEDEPAPTAAAPAAPSARAPAPGAPPRKGPRYRLVDEPAPQASKADPWAKFTPAPPAASSGERYVLEPVEPAAFSTRIWLNDSGEHVVAALVACVPLLLLVGIRRWLVWLTRPAEAGPR